VDTWLRQDGPEVDTWLRQDGPEVDTWLRQDGPEVDTWLRQDRMGKSGFESMQRLLARGLYPTPM
jgi:hypothetical protein